MTYLPLEALPLENRFVERLPGDPRTDRASRQVEGACFSPATPTPVSAPRLLVLVPEVAALLGLSTAESETLVEVLAGNRVLPGMKPYAACYGGHQFGNWAGQLGDGRAITLGEVRAPDGASYELQLKGAGPTAYSRRADGRAVLRSSVRELVTSEAMFHLGVPTTRALSLVSTGDPVTRDMLYDGNPRDEPGAVVCRVARSFLRFGSYQIHAARGDDDLLERLVRFTIDEHFPALAGRAEPPVAELFAEVARRTAALVVDWMRVGFVHGVMNTDNMSILGLTIDYGPYGWLDAYDPDWTPNTTDAHGRRYRYGHQPMVARWNLLQLARALSPLVDDVGPLEDTLRAWGPDVDRRSLEMMLAKLGLDPARGEPDEDAALVSDLFGVLVATETDMTLFYRGLGALSASPEPKAPRREALRAAFYADEVPREAAETIEAWLERWAARARREGITDAERRARMDAVNPLYVPRNYLVHEAIERAEAGDPGGVVELLDVFRRPYVEQPGRERFAAKRPDWARHKPGCSMLSCSS